MPESRSKPVKTLDEMTELELAEEMVKAARAVKTSLPSGSLFVLLAFDKSQIAQYVANCQRGPMIQILRETADRLEAKEHVTR